MKKIFLSSIVAISLLLGSSVQAFASPLETNPSNTSTDATNTIVSNLENNINKVQSDINSNNNDINNINNEISQLNEEKNNLEGSLKTQQDQLNACIKQLYENNNVNPYLAAIFTAKNFGNLISQIYTTSQVVSYQNGIMDKVQDTLDQINTKSNELNSKKQQLTTLKESNQTQLAELKAQVVSATELVSSNEATKLKESYKKTEDVAITSTTTTSATSNTNSNANTSFNTSSVSSTTIKNTNSLKMDTSTTPSLQLATSINTAPQSAQNVIEYAYKFIGTPYVWGATGPSSFDCSGFVQYVYKHFGIDLPRTTYQQINVGTPVSESDLQPGDLVFEIGTASAPQHVGIYIGNGQIINAVKPGVGVAVSKIYEFVAARRVL